jgi:hypothetical protein
MSANSLGEGLVAKYEVTKLNDPTGKHEGCNYFVLDPQHDPTARIALKAYADAILPYRPQLSADITEWLSNLMIEDAKEGVAKAREEMMASLRDYAREESNG